MSKGQDTRKTKYYNKQTTHKTVLSKKEKKWRIKATIKTSKPWGRVDEQGILTSICSGEKWRQYLKFWTLLSEMLRNINAITDNRIGSKNSEI